MFLDSLVEQCYKSLPRYSEALDYLHSRGVTDEEIKLFKLGFRRVITVADDGTEDFKNFVKETNNGRSLENKIIFPLYDMLGQIVGIFSRAVETKEFKFYLTQEAKFSGVFFGFWQSLPEIYKTGRVFTVEGPFDFFAFRKAYTNSVATLTAGLSDAQYNLLHFFAENIVTVFDSDKAGRRAAAEAQQWPGIKSVELGFKDPNACLKYWDQKKFIERVKEKVGEVLLFS
jgi:DNA primase